MTCSALFQSPCFLFGFLPILLVAYWAIPKRRWKMSVLLASGLAFYSLWDWRFSGLLIAAGLVDYTVALLMARSARRRAHWLLGSLAFNLGVLFYFKYAFFGASTLVSVLGFFGVEARVPFAALVLPLGISFFTFKTLSYTIDVYRREVTPTRDLLKYLAFVCLLPDIVAGPIVRYRDVSDQMDRLPRRLEANAIAIGVFFFAIGLFKKVVIADSIGAFVDPLWLAPINITTPQAWLAVLGYTVRLYFDFSGYSDMALGLAALLGLTFPINFRAPYQALNPSDFWRRWHISLSSWLRDYVYIPLGGNRGKPWRLRVNLLAVMLIGGLWHGAAWTFVLWGAYHGLLLVLYKETAPRWDALPRVAQRLLMLFLAAMGWVLFRAPDVKNALAMYHALFVPYATEAWRGILPASLAVAAA